MAFDLVGRGVLNTEHVRKLQEKLNIAKFVKPILSQNQYFHLVRWLVINGIAGDSEVTKLSKVMKEEAFAGI